jgi:hypothetical protein
MRGLPEGAMVPVGQCWHLAQRWYHNRLDLDYRPRTAEETYAVFQEVGLTGVFWQLG